MRDVLVYVSITLNGYPGTANTHAPSTLRRRNLKRVLITLKAHQMFSVLTTPEKFENAPFTGHSGFVFEEDLAREISRLS